MAQLKELISKRGNCKGKLTRYNRYFQEIKLVDSGLDTHIKEVSRRYADIKLLLSEFESLHEQIVILREAAEERNNDEEDLASFETLFYALSAETDVFIEEQFKRNNKEPQSQPSAAVQKKINVALPDIALPKFKGNFDTWKEFIDTFNALVHNNPAMSPVEKLHYLKSCMIEDAATVINMLAATEENYDVARQMLQKRFEHKRLTVNKHIANIYNFPKIIKGTAKEYRLLLDTINASLLCLESLHVTTADWDPLLIYIVADKIDSRTRQEWESKCDRDLPQWQGFVEFLYKRCEVLETFADYKKPAFESQSYLQQRLVKGQRPGQFSHVSVQQNCSCCNKSHSIKDCFKFTKMPVSARYHLLRRKRLCFKCLQVLEGTHVCSGQDCSKCGKPHHTILHYERKENPTNEPNERSEKEGNPSTSSVKVGLHAVIGNDQVLLSTAMVKVKTQTNDLIDCRVLLDNGSQPNLVTKALFKKLGIESTNTNICISGVNNAESRAVGKAAINIRNYSEDYDCNVTCYIVNNITGNLPTTSFASKGFKPPPGVKLADPSFNISRPIDMLLGADVFYDIMSEGQIRLGNGLPILQRTKLGWIAGGGYVSYSRTNKLVINHCTINHNDDEAENLNWQVNRFWEVETIENMESLLSTDEQKCEDIFKETTKRNKEGRFVVKIPWKETRHMLGKSFTTAKSRFYSMERKLQQNPMLQEAYRSFMKEYEEMGHMRCITNVTDEHITSGYFMPHHAVLNESSTTTKVRVVFDASCKTDTDLSLNDVQLVGPTIQSDLFSLLLKFRKHNVVLTADVQKMYRQIELDEDDKKYHRILWRADAKEPIRCYELQTVTYGTASAPFLAIRCLFALAEESTEKYPKEAEIMKREFYVDDLLTGAETLEEATVIKKTITQILQSAGLNLHKWASNHPQLCPDSSSERSIRIGDKTKRTLGTHWQVESDTLQYKLELQPIVHPISKRKVLATTAKIFDPLGILGPIVVVAKIILQTSWQETLGWDDPLPEPLQRNWSEFESQLEGLNSIIIPRKVFVRNADSMQLHGFCDASMKAYGACIYIRSKIKDHWSSTLLCAKSKVAPLKTITLPRLELQGALLLAKLITKVKESMDLTGQQTYLWCDSTIVLGWLQSAPNRWKIFVSNRVSQIQQLTKNATWNHVSSFDNPADIISRGATVGELNESKLWWAGPTWLNDRDIPFATLEISEQELPDEIKSITATHLITPKHDLNLINKYSSASKLIRVVAYCRRYIYNRLQRCGQNGPLTTKELSDALDCLIRTVQTLEFKTDLVALRIQGVIPINSKLKGLCPILDSDGIMRVGGRLNNDFYPFNKQHPVLLPKNHKLTVLLMQREHVKHLHCSPQALLAIVRERFWPLGGRCMAKQIVRKCTTCYRHNPKTHTPLMGQLPSCRTTPKPAFSNTGVDYAGPVLLKDKRTRGCKLIKAYICVFVCLVTKAVHLELVADLTSECFLAALRRFASRRGMPTVMHSDNATNFRGARNELLKFISSKSVTQCIKERLSVDNIEWKFIPPNSPHFGGLWEASVKSVKGLLKRVLGNAHLIYEEMYTVLVQIEAILNSRPLSSLSNDPNDLAPLTPGHFLIGQAMTTVPDQDVKDLPLPRLSRYQRLQQLQQHFWQRWSKEYVSELQQRQKWTKAANLPVGAMVLLREENLPPLKWKMGRVLEVYPGKDNVARVARIKTSSGEYVRAVHKLCVLPQIEEN